MALLRRLWCDKEYSSQQTNVPAHAKLSTQKPKAVAATFREVMSLHTFMPCAMQVTETKAPSKRANLEHAGKRRLLLQHASERHSAGL